MGEISFSPLYHLTLGAGIPRLEVQVNVIMSPISIRSFDEVITGLPGGTEIKFGCHNVVNLHSESYMHVV